MLQQLRVRPRLARVRADRGDPYERRTTDAILAIGGTILAIAAVALLIAPAGADRAAQGGPGPAPGPAGDRGSELAEPAFAPFLADGTITTPEYRAAIDELFRCFDARGVKHSSARWAVSGSGKRSLDYTTAGGGAGVDACQAPFVQQVLIPWENQFLRSMPTEAEVTAWRSAVLECVAGYGHNAATFEVVLRLAAGGLGPAEREAADACLVATPLAGV